MRDEKNRNEAHLRSLDEFIAVRKAATSAGNRSITARLQAWRAHSARSALGKSLDMFASTSAIPWYRLALQTTPLTTLAIFVAGSLILKETYPFRIFPCFRHRQRPGRITW